MLPSLLDLFLENASVLILKRNLLWLNFYNDFPAAFLKVPSVLAVLRTCLWSTPKICCKIFCVSGIIFRRSWKGSRVRDLAQCVTLSRTPLTRLFSVRWDNNILDLCFGDWGESCWFMRLDQDLQILRHCSCLCDCGLFIYTVCQGSSKGWCREFHHAVYGTHVCDPPPLLFHPETRQRRSHFHVW